MGIGLSSGWTLGIDAGKRRAGKQSKGKASVWMAGCDARCGAVRCSAVRFVFSFLGCLIIARWLEMVARDSSSETWLVEFSWF